jgi:hypothetical protein
VAIVYIHRRRDNNNIFYIGISKNKRRAYETYSKSGSRRNIFWSRFSRYIMSLSSEVTGFKEKCILRAIKLNKLYKGFIWKRC